MYASDWPHWDFDLPSVFLHLPFLSEQAKRNILGLNAARLFSLDVPAGQAVPPPHVLEQRVRRPIQRGHDLIAVEAVEVVQD